MNEIQILLGKMTVVLKYLTAFLKFSYSEFLFLLFVF